MAGDYFWRQIKNFKGYNNNWKLGYRSYDTPDTYIHKPGLKFRSTVNSTWAYKTVDCGTATHQFKLYLAVPHSMWHWGNYLCQIKFSSSINHDQCKDQLHRVDGRGNELTCKMLIIPPVWRYMLVLQRFCFWITKRTGNRWSQNSLPTCGTRKTKYSQILFWTL